MCLTFIKHEPQYVLSQKKAVWSAYIHVTTATAHHPTRVFVLLHRTYLKQKKHINTSMLPQPNIKPTTKITNKMHDID